jgi:hypothetical protein
MANSLNSSPDRHTLHRQQTNKLVKAGDIPGFRHQGCSPFPRAVCLAAQLAPTTGSSNGASLARGPFIADGSFEVFVGRLVVAAFFKAFTKRFALALLGKVCCCVSWSSVSPFSNRSSKRWVRLSLAPRCSRSSVLVGSGSSEFPL